MALGYIPGIRVTLGYILNFNAKLSDLRQGSCSYTTRIRRCWRLHSFKEAQDKHSSESHSICSCGHCWCCGGSDPDFNEQATLVWRHSYPCKTEHNNHLKLLSKGGTYKIFFAGSFKYFLFGLALHGSVNISFENDNQFFSFLQYSYLIYRGRSVWIICYPSSKDSIGFLRNHELNIL